MTTPPPHAGNEISDLLFGLDAADFDFEIDEHEHEQREQQPETKDKEEPSTHSPSPTSSPAPSPPPLLPTPAVIAFATAAGRTLPPPSDAALKRARALVAQAEKDVDIDERVKRPRVTPEKSGEPSRPSQSQPLSQPLPQPSAGSQKTPGSAPLPLPEDTFVTPLRTGFATASGRPVAPVSAAARARALALFSQSPPASQEETPLAAKTGLRDVSRAAAPPSSTPGPSSRAQALALFGEDDAGTSHSSTGFGAASAFSPATGFQLGSGRAAPVPSSESLARARALFDDLETSPSSAPAPLPRATSPIPSTPAPASQFTPATSQFTAPRPIRPSTPSRIPLHPIPPNSMAPPETPATPASIKLPRRIEIRPPTAGTPRRIGLGMGTTPAKGKKPRKSFVTPFKAGSSSTPSRSAPAPASSPLKTERIWKPVFDLTPRLHRVSMRAAKLIPGFYAPEELALMGYPDEIWILSIENALYYQFIAEDASPLGTDQTLKRLKYEGCELATAKWVENHWRLILWKLAGQVKARPSLFEEKWNWYEVLCQLKYRYEREYGAAQRPLVRRIQEHDSSPSLPMVLCVAGIQRPEPVLNDKNEPVAQRPVLDLTDGWYHIRALTDECLARAIAKGKIKVGRKLAISGAKLESGSDGADVFEAYDKSHLVLSGNSTHLARWDARLGAQSQPFVAGLSSLTVDGGSIVLMDIVLSKVFPLAFVPADRGNREAPWNEDEEQARADAWKEKYEAESQRLQEEMRRNLEKIEDLAGMLASAAEDAGVSPSSEPPESLDDDFDDLLAAGAGAMARLRALPSSTIVHLARHAARRVHDAVAEEHAQLEQSLLESCPPRAVRDFRIVRFADARRGDKEPARTGMLQVWDARALSGALAEGKRYLVSNLIPGRNGDWSAPAPGRMKEVYLHTRRDTRWKMVEVVERGKD